MSTPTTDLAPPTLLGGVARVNLLPPEIAEQARFRRTQAVLGATVLVAVVAVGGGWSLAAADTRGAGTRLADAQAQGARLQAQKAQYAQVPAVQRQVAAADAQLTLAMGREVLWSQVLNNLGLSIPQRVWLTQLQVTENVDLSTRTTGPSAAPQNPLQPPGAIGQVQFSGVGLAHDDVAAWLESLKSENGYAAAYFSSSTKAKIGTQDVVNFTSTAVLTEKNLSHRFDPAGSPR